MSRPSRIWALVPAAGTGARMGAACPKQYLSLVGRPVIVHTLERLCACDAVQGVLVGVASQDEYWPALDQELRRLDKLIGTFTGGAERAQTVLNGLRALARRAGPADWVLVHDAARPCVTCGDIDKLVAAIAGSPSGALLAVPVADTVKRVDAGYHVIETVPRTGLWRALTPQVFQIDLLTAALTRALAAGATVTDEASAIEHMGGKPCVVPGRADNIKITLPEDLALAELFIKRQQTEGP